MFSFFKKSKVKPGETVTKELHNMILADYEETITRYREYIVPELQGELEIVRNNYSETLELLQTYDEVNDLYLDRIKELTAENENLRKKIIKLKKLSKTKPIFWNGFDEPDQIENTKTCSKCKQSKPKSEFYICKGKKDGLQSQCKDCKKANRK